MKKAVEKVENKKMGLKNGIIKKNETIWYQKYTGK